MRAGFFVQQPLHNGGTWDFAQLKEGCSPAHIAFHAVYSLRTIIERGWVKRCRFSPLQSKVAETMLWTCYGGSPHLLTFLRNTTLTSSRRPDLNTAWRDYTHNYARLEQACAAGQAMDSASACAVVAAAMDLAYAGLTSSSFEDSDDFVTRLMLRPLQLVLLFESQTSTVGDDGGGLGGGGVRE